MITPRPIGTQADKSPYSNALAEVVQCIPKDPDDGLLNVEDTINAMDILASCAGIPKWSHLKYQLRLKSERYKAVAQDAARYRWLCDKPDGKAGIDAAIDAAIAQQFQRKEA